MIWSCGYKSGPDYGPAPAPPAPSDPAWAALKPLIDRNCGSCHNGSNTLPQFVSGAVFKASKAKAKITSGAMPPSGGLSDSDKKALLAYLG